MHGRLGRLRGGRNVIVARMTGNFFFVVCRGEISSKSESRPGYASRYYAQLLVHLWRSELRNERNWRISQWHLKSAHVYFCRASCFIKNFALSHRLREELACHGIQFAFVRFEWRQCGAKAYSAKVAQWPETQLEHQFISLFFSY